MATSRQFPPKEETNLNPKKIRLDGGTQPRETPDFVAIEEYAEAMKGGAEFPPVDVFYDGTDYWIADGYHRTRAAILAGLKRIGAIVHMGDKRDATLFSVSANALHGIRRTNQDKRRAVMKLLNDPEWRLWNDTEIARQCAVSPSMVRSYRKESINPPSTIRLVKRDGEPELVETSRSQKRPIITPDEAAVIKPPDDQEIQQRTSVATRLRFLNWLRDNRVDFDPNFKVELLGTTFIRTKTAIHAVVENMSVHEFKDAFATVLISLQSVESKRPLKAVIVGQSNHSVHPWIDQARKCGVDFIEQS